MGWVLFKLDEPEAALIYLFDAYDRLPDPEVAAHLGEVLWELDRQDEARTVWNRSLEDNPDSEVLQQTMERLIQ